MTIRAEWLTGPVARSPEALAMWREMYEADKSASIASGPGWWRLMEAAFAVPNTPCMVVLRESGRLVAVWPLAIRARRGRWITVRTLIHANGHHTYYGDPVIAGDAPQGSIARLHEELRRVRHVDRIDIRRLRMLGLVPNGGPDALTNDPVIPLGSEAVPIRSRMRREMERCHRRLEDLGPVSIEWLTGPSLAGIGTEFARLHTALKTMQHQWQLFSEHPRSGERLGPALVEASREMDIGAVCIKVADRIQGLLIVFSRERRSLTWRSAWEPTLARFGLGALLIREAIRVCADRGDSELRLGPGAEPYKLEWASQVSQVATYRRSRPTPTQLIVAVGRALRRGAHLTVPCGRVPG